jgi:RNA polymerase sigma-70 factor, ECF subfamily
VDIWITQALPGAVAYAASLLGDREKADDIVQDCVCRLLVHAARYDLPRDGRRLLFRSITNACLNLVTRERPMVSIDEIGRTSLNGLWEFEDVVAVEPLSLVIAEETREIVHQGLNALPVHQRSAIELWSFGYSIAEIAEMLSVSPGNARTIIYRAKKSLEEFLIEQGVERGGT